MERIIELFRYKIKSFSKSIDFLEKLLNSQQILGYLHSDLVR